MKRVFLAMIAVALLAACSDGGADGNGGADSGTDGDADGDADGDGDGDADGDTDTDTDADAPEVCDPPVELADSSSPDHVVTDCSDDTELRAALAAGGVITFDCGAATIDVTASTELPNDADAERDRAG